MPKKTARQSPGQLPMFMSAGEIMKNYQPLEGDRQEHYDEREGETTARKFTTAGHPNAKLTTYDKEEGFAKYRNNTADTHYRETGHPETDTQLWDRKLNEAQMPLDEYRDVHGGGFLNDRTPGWNTLMRRDTAPKPMTYERGHTGTWEDREQDQAEYVQNKQDEHRYDREGGDSLHGMLSSAMRPGGEGFTGQVHLGTQFGGSNKPQILGAHHRIAAMNDIDPNRLLPVVHHKSIWEARAGFAGHDYT